MSRRVTEWSENLEDLNPQKGDLIEIDKIIYHHWGMYTSDKKIISFEPVDTAIMVLSLKFDDLVPAEVKIQSIKKATGQSRFRINNKPKLDKTTRSYSEIEELIETCLRCPRQLEYSLKYFNCEHFVTCLKFGVAYSDQMSSEKQFLFTLGLNMGASYLRELNNEWETPDDAFRPMLEALEASMKNEILVKPPIQRKVEQQLERLFGKYNTKYLF
ncbi:phospholipase A and acyltransferase 1-like [Tribolium madens]|uniref:phospholipase A and acyltransferase 1-like n=1 Tax=Tribolium madens TaxID=41895 RepID=UPI001CF72B06|nr:phospholipase A and acyltransferase 1-like [Tribolium madens]